MPVIVFTFCIILIIKVMRAAQNLANARKCSEPKVEPISNLNHSALLVPFQRKKYRGNVSAVPWHFLDYFSIGKVLLSRETNRPEMLTQEHAYN